MTKRRSKNALILEWLVDVIGQAEADGYQQNDECGCAWMESLGPPQITWADGNKMGVRLPNGERFTVSVSRHGSDRDPYVRA